MRRRYCLFLITLLLFLHTAVLHAQGVTWQERRTQHFALLYPTEAEATAAQYAQFVDGIYDEISTFWDYRTPPPVVLRIYPTLELYYEVNPLAAKVPGVVAHAHTGRREISIAIPQTAGQSDEEIRNNVRHELTHIVAADLSGGRLTTPWQEGIAQYVEHPTQHLERKMELMRQIIAENRLLSWRDLNHPGATYADPRVGYPESFTIVAFLIERNGMGRFRSFVEAMKDSTGYRGALAATYGTSPDALEREWRAQLSHFVTEGYRSPATASGGTRGIGLDEPEMLIAQGDYGGALQRLRPLVATLRNAGESQSSALSRAQSLLARAEAGLRATEFATDAREALIRGDYQSASAASTAGQKELETMGQAGEPAGASPAPAEASPAATGIAAVLAEYGTLARRGLEADAQLKEAGLLLRRFRIRDAQVLLDTAYATFTELGDQPRLAQARAALLLINRGEQLLAAACLVSSAVLLAWSGHRRYAERRTALPLT